MGEVDGALLRIGDVCACFVTIAHSETKQSPAGLWLFVPRMFQKSEVFGSSHGTLVYHCLSSRMHTKKEYGNRLLKIYRARFSTYAVQVQVQRRRSDLSTELASKKATCGAPAPFRACASQKRLLVRQSTLNV